MQTNQITLDLDKFILAKLEQLDVIGVNVSNLTLDHFAYSTSSTAEYEQLISDSSQYSIQIAELELKGRRVSFNQLTPAVSSNGFMIDAFELIEPIPGQICTAGLDHIEFVIEDSFESFMLAYPNVNWDITKLNLAKFAKLSYGFEDGTSVKFHLNNIIDEI